MKRVCVQWRDSISMNRWQSKELLQEFAAEDNLLHESVGYLYSLEDDAITIVQSTALYENGNLSEALKVPREAVVSIRYLSLGKAIS